MTSGINKIEMAEDDEKLSTAFKERGVAGVSEYISQKLNEWKNETLNIAVTGRSGVGKSTFINAIRDNLQDEDNPNYAPIGHKETTMDAKPYRHPENPNLVFWDLPGLGTRAFKRETYMSDDRINFKRYDMFLILSADRFFEDENWLIEEIIKSGKLFLFVRTKVDVELDNDRKCRKQKANPENILLEIRNDCMSRIKEMPGISELFSDLYLIGSLEIENKLLDFNKLVARLVSGLSGLKKEVLIFSLQRQTPSLLMAKKQALSNRIWKISTLSAVCGAVPVPGVSFVVDITLILHEVIFYRQQLGLTNEDLEHLSNFLHIPEDELIKKHDLKIFTMEWTAKGLASLLGSFMISEAAESVASFVIPIIGSVISGVLSYNNTSRMLHQILDHMMSDAEKISCIIEEHTRSFDVDAYTQI